MHIYVGSLLPFSSFKGVLTVATMTFVEEKSIKYGVDKVYLRVTDFVVVSYCKTTGGKNCSI